MCAVCNAGNIQDSLYYKSLRSYTGYITPAEYFVTIDEFYQFTIAIVAESKALLRKALPGFWLTSIIREPKLLSSLADVLPRI